MVNVKVNRGPSWSGDRQYVKRREGSEDRPDLSLDFEGVPDPSRTLQHNPANPNEVVFEGQTFQFQIRV